MIAKVPRSARSMCPTCGSWRNVAQWVHKESHVCWVFLWSLKKTLGDSEVYQDQADQLRVVERRGTIECERRTRQLQSFVTKLFHGTYEVRLTQLEKEVVVYYKEREKDPYKQV